MYFQKWQEVVPFVKQLSQLANSFQKHSADELIGKRQKLAQLLKGLGVLLYSPGDGGGLPFVINPYGKYCLSMPNSVTNRFVCIDMSICSIADVHDLPVVGAQFWRKPIFN